MNEFIKENKIIMFGISIPLVFIFIMIGISLTPNLIVAEPKYSMVFFTETYNSKDDYNVYVRDGKINITVENKEIKEGKVRGEKVRLWVFNPIDKSKQEIPLILPNNSNDEKENIYIEIPEFDNHLINSSSLSKDGYSFVKYKYRSSYGNPMRLFSGSRRYRASFIEKNGKEIRIPDFENNNVKFIGWIQL